MSTPPTATLPDSELQLQRATLTVNGMKCAGCVQNVEKRLLNQPGVVSASVNLVTGIATVEYTVNTVEPALLADSLTEAGFPSQSHAAAEQQGDRLNRSQEQTNTSHRLRQILLALLLVVLSGLGHLEQLLPINLGGLSNIWLHWGLATLALLGPGREMLLDGWRGIRQQAPNMNTLISLGTLTAYIASVVALLVPTLGWECFFDEPVMIVGLILLGRTLEQQARNRAMADFQALLALQPASARLLPDLDSPVSVEIPVSQVQLGARLQVLPGESFPVDGEILDGTTEVDESMLTGESLPVVKRSGEAVIGGTRNQSGTVIIQTTRTGQDTVLAQIIQLVEAAQTRKAPIQRLADQIAGYFTYGVLAIALITFGFWLLVGTHLWPEVLQVSSVTPHHSLMQGQPHPVLLSLKLAIAVLVIACPCALGLATPTAILVGTSLGAERGLLIRGGDVLEQVERLTTIVFDKTGTLTTGQLQITEHWLAPTESGWTWEQLLQLAAAVEAGVQHPVATAIQQAAAAQSLALLPAQNFQLLPGSGVRAEVDGQWVQVGHLGWLEQQGVEIPAEAQAWSQTLASQGKSLVFVAITGTLVGGFAAADLLRTDAIATVAQLRDLGFQIKVMTGDHAATASTVLQPLGLAPDSIIAEVNPGEKAAAIATLQAQGQRVAMVGDGSNDAPALAQAEVGIALSSGTDVAVETAQIVLMGRAFSEERSPLADVVEVIRLSRATLSKIRQNLVWALGYNTLGIPVAAGILLPQFGVLLSPATAVAFMALSSVSVVTSSLWLRYSFRH